jgi:protein CpxP
MERKKYYIIIIVILLISNVSLIALHFMRPMPKNGPRDIIIEKLHFNEDQVKKYDVLIEKHQSSIRKNEKEISTLKSKLYSSLDSNQNVLDSIVAQINTVQKHIEETHIAHFKEISLICKDDQLKDFQKLTYDLAALFGRKKPN